ncbi:SNF2 family N-terminal domain-containing protein [Desarmillaria tabescens]|uniref:DNA helicase n=1 Tax=Armillaria tabescens TaxID=1929756 RepID=A0AA39N6P2_ARMTA|nr:SNF2 family N-terminal domain-containing protein [Desarmillaria tabescens]KAK0459393.1 SNF2 family N-terminal domain-containing protein [Desarmillaria tabescens]
MAPTSRKRGRNEVMQDDMQNVVEARREALIEERQKQLERIYDRHDTLVREAFHMERFTLMLGYDPKEAKAEQTGVINDYKAQYDLLNTAGPSSGRRTRSERRQIVTAPTHVSPESVKKGKGKANSSTIWDILSTARPSPVKGKGKERASMSMDSASVPVGRKALPKDHHSVVDVEMDSISAPIGKGRKKAKFGPSEVPEETSIVGRRYTSESRRQHVGSKPSGGSVSTAGRRLRSQDTTSVGAVDTNAPTTTGLFTPEPVPSVGDHHSVMGPPSTPRRQHIGHSDSEIVPAIGKQHHTSSNGISTRKRPREESDAESLAGKSPATISTRGGRALPARAAAHRVTAPPPPPSPYSNIKRIKLIVRRPPPSYTNPNQLPPPPKHGSSISAFLSSYTTMDHKDVSTRILQESIRRDADILERASKLKEEGRWFYRSEEEGDIAQVLETPQGPERTTKDVWDYCIEQIVALGQAEVKRPIGAQIASQIASKVKVYWEGQHAKQDKKRAQEEKRLKILAKQTIKEVTSAWGKIVLHIRRQEQVEREAEELKRGHEHLDAILDQSGLLLETQQSSLVRRSRSTSSDGFGLWGSEGGDSDDSEGDGEEGDDDVDDDDSGEEEPEPEQEQSDGDEEGDDDVDGDTIALLGDRQDTPISQNIEATPTASTPVLPSRGSIAPDDVVHDESMMLALEDLLILPESSPPPTPTSPLYPLESPSLSSLPNVQVRDASPLDNSVAPSDYAETVPSSVSVVASPRQCDGSVMTRNPTSPKNMQSAGTQIVTSEIDLLSCETQAEGAVDEVSAQTTLEQNTEVNRVHPFAKVINNETRPRRTDADAGVNGMEPHAIGDEVTRSDAPEEQEQELPKLPINPDHDDSAAVRPDEPEEAEQELPKLPIVPEYLKPFAVAPVEWDADAPIKPPLLLRGVLRPYQQTGLEWLTTLHRNNLNGILADEMGLGKTIQTISLLAHLACDRGIWGPHLIIVPTSVLLNWEMEFKKRRKELRQGWNDKYHFNVCITSYTLASRDAHIFKRRAWYYMILDEAHMIKNFKSQRWNILLMFRSFRRLLLTGTPLQNNLTELWALLQFLMSGSNFANLKEFGDWFSNPLEKAIEMGNAHDDETMQRVSKLHTRDVEKELPSKFEHLMLCPLSKRQRYLYDEFMSRAHTQDALQSGVYQKIANILMQLRKVCNHPDLFEVRPIVTSFAMTRSAIADFEIKELLIRRRLLTEEEESLNLDFLGLRFIDRQNTSEFGAMGTRRLDATSHLPFIFELPGEPPPKDMRTIDGFRAYATWKSRADKIAHWIHVAYVNRHRIQMYPITSCEMIAPSSRCPYVDQTAYLDTMITTHKMVKTYAERSDEMASTIDRFAFATPAVVALDIPCIAFPSLPINQIPRDFDAVLHKSSVKLQIAFPDPSLLQYDCGKLQQLNLLLREKKAGGHRVLIFTQMTRILDILEIFLNFHGYLYLRLDGATKIEDRQYITERFNADSRIFCFIASSSIRCLTGADTVVFYDSDFQSSNGSAHRIGQIRDVHIYRFVSQYTVEEAMLRKANQKRSLDDLVIQKGGFDWRTIFNDEKALTNALEEFDDQEDAHAAAVATREEVAIVGADEADFGEGETTRDVDNRESEQVDVEQQPEEVQEEEEDEEEGGTIADYMLAFVKQDYDYFRDWRV